MPFRLLAVALLVSALAAPCAALPSAPPAERGLPLLRMFQPRDYRAHEQVWRIVERPDGVMYFGNLNRVLEYDGLGWRSIDVPGGSYVRALATDAAGTVWVAGINELGRLVSGPDGHLVYESLRGLVPAATGDLGTIWCVHALPDGVYFQSNRAILRWDGTGFTVRPLDEKRTLLSYADGAALWVPREQEWGRLHPDGRWETVLTPPAGFGLPRFFLPDGRGGYLVGSGTEGLWRLAEGRFTRLTTPLDGWLKTKKLYAGQALPGGRYLFTSLQGGAVITGPDFEPEVLLDDKAGLGTDTVISSYVDRQGALWLGTDRGIARVEYAASMTVFNEVHGLGRSGSESVQRVGDRLLLVNARNVFELKAAAESPGHVVFRESLNESDRLTNLVRLADGVLAPGLTGLTWIKDGKSERLPGPGGVREIVEVPGQAGRFVGTHLNGIASWRRDGAGWIFEGAWPEFAGEMRSLVPDGEGGLWTSTPNAGVIRLEPHAAEPRAARLERFAEEAGLPVGRNRVWLTLVGGTPLFGTERGLFRFDPATRRFRPETAYGERFSDGGTVVRLVTPDGRGGLWMARESRRDVPPGILYARDGRWTELPMPDIARLNNFSFLAWEERAGREILWIGGQAELRRLDVTAWREQPPVAPLRTLIRTVQAGRGRWLRPEGAAVPLPAAENTLRFTFATPGLGGEPDGLHETCLHGFADGEAVVSAAGERTFTNLPPGDYVFEVRGRSGDGRWSEPARFAFTVLAPWWRTAPALTGWAALFGLALFAYIRWRIRRLTRERNRLEAVVGDRTAELAQKNRELERLHRLDQDEKLAARLAEEKAQLELLRYQLNPHFLYNSLNSIRALVFTNAEAAGEMVTRLSEFCRWTLTRGADGMTTVGEEIEMLQAYLDIERTRWQEGLRARIEVDAVVKGDPLPQFLFLPLVENAIKYGGRTSPGLLEVTVSVRREDDELVCEVANTGEWVTPQARPAADSTRIGLDNLRRRLARHYGPDCRPEVVTMTGWVCVRLRLSRRPNRPGSASPV